METVITENLWAIKTVSQFLRMGGDALGRKGNKHGNAQDRLQ